MRKIFNFLFKKYIPKKDVIKTISEIYDITISEIGDVMNENSKCCTITYYYVISDTSFSTSLTIYVDESQLSSQREEIGIADKLANLLNVDIIVPLPNHLSDNYPENCWLLITPLSKKIIVTEIVDENDENFKIDDDSIFEIE
jgi:hypothetical protein